MTPLKHYHFGSKAPSTIPDATQPCKGPDGKTVEKPDFCDGPASNFGVDERAEVALLSRSITLSGRQAWQSQAIYESGATIVATASDDKRVHLFSTATGGQTGTLRPTFAAAGSTQDGAVTWQGLAGGDTHWGGEIRLLAGANRANAITIRGVELEEFGKDQLGSYPIHFQMVGALPNLAAGGPSIIGNSIHHSFNKCIAMHMTNNGIISNNVCARITGHIFYLENGTEQGNTFRFNLGMGAENTRLAFSKLVQPFWSGDYMNALVPLNFDQLNLPDTDDPASPRGPSSGFWITNPNNNLIANSVAGCQGAGVAYWYRLTPASHFQPFGKMTDNRAHGCNFGFNTAADVGSNGLEPAPRTGGTINGKDLVAHIDHLTVTRSRDRGIWTRPGWYAINEARMAGNRDAVTVVSGGGTEGIEPGFWGQFANSVVVGISQNNVDRFGPSECFDPGNGRQDGCAQIAGNPTKGYPEPSWNWGGFMFYDGPARLENVRFVNFVVNAFGLSKAGAPIDPRTSLLTVADQTNINNMLNRQGAAAFKGFPIYEGDAALAWFQTNVNLYPPTQYTEGIRFENSDLQHQVYTQGVNLGAFLDGDKNTAILDLDATLSGYKVTDSNGVDLGTKGRFPISLNNLPYNGVTQDVSRGNGGDSVDECFASELRMFSPKIGPLG